MCYCFFPRACVKTTLAIVSTLLFLVAGFSYFVAGYSYESDVLSAFHKDVRTYVFEGFLALGTVLLLAAAAGLCTTFRYNTCSCCMLGIFSFIAILGFGVWLAAAIFVYHSLTTAVLNEECPSSNSLLQDINTVFTKMDEEMCSTNCPCDQTYKDNFTDR